MRIKQFTAQELTWHPQLGPVLLWDINSLTECLAFDDLDGSKERPNHSVIMSKHGHNMNVAQTTKMTKHPPILAGKSECYFLTNPSFSYLDDMSNHRITFVF